MPEYSDENRGAIWKNDRKETERHPDFKGSLNVEGVDFWVSAWKREPDANPRAPALRFSVQRKDDQPAAQAQEPKAEPAPPAGDQFSDDIPF